MNKPLLFSLLLFCFTATKAQIILPAMRVFNVKKPVTIFLGGGGNSSQTAALLQNNCNPVLVNNMFLGGGGYSSQTAALLQNNCNTVLVNNM
ncbi:hypothetical protein, partial [uncultured Mucilaginibacter sp.]|uniref:hypothetical protein n=1 Tax=uncultured Mucilaginibacter sp. TaxID=797541 RepID=UPI0025D3BB87